MFHSAVTKLTSWYLLILMSISILFSFTIYNVVATEVDNRLSDLQVRLEKPNANSYLLPNPRLFSEFRHGQQTTAEHNIMTILIYVNLVILIGGGALSYLLARRTLMQIEHYHETQSRFVSDASHELRTPLAAMKTELEVALRNKKMSRADMQEQLTSSLEEVERLSSLSQTLLQLSRLNHTGLDIGPVDLGTSLAEIVQRYDKNAKRIVLDLPKTQLMIKGNKAGVEELFTILVDNALKYSPVKSKVHAKLTKRDKQAVFTISNTGPGIPADKLPHIFERFYRADESHTSKSGSGLGLALAKELVSFHRGELSVSSTINKNTTFTVSLHLLNQK